MTITTTTPDTDELLPAARELAARERSVPPKRRIQDALSIGFRRASKIHDQLRAEHADQRRARQRQMRSIAGRKRPRPALLARSRPAVEPQVKPRSGRLSRWPLLLLAAPAVVAIWAGWVDLGRLTGFGVVHPLPGIVDRFSINTAITLPIGLETYAAYALNVWLAGAGSGRARTFARWSALGSLLLGFSGQAAYHLMIAAGMTTAPWPITLVVSGVPVAVLGMGAALWHLAHTPEENS